MARTNYPLYSRSDDVEGIDASERDFIDEKLSVYYEAAPRGGGAAGRGGDVWLTNQATAIILSWTLLLLSSATARQ